MTAPSRMLIPLLLASALCAAPASAADDDSFASAVVAAIRDARGSARLQEVKAAQADKAAKAAADAKGGFFPAWPAGWTVDLSARFPRNDDSVQGKIGDCHDFAAVSVLEAAMTRRGAPRRLSPADLFVSHTVLGPAFFSGLAAKGDGPSDGGQMAEDGAYAITHGVATRLDYDAFQSAYAAYRKSVLDPEVGSLLKGLPPSPATGLVLWADRSLVAGDLSARTHAVMERTLRSIDPRVADERRETRDLMRGLRIVARSFATDPAVYRDAYEAGGALRREPAVRCVALGYERARLIRAELDAGRPVAVSLDIEGMVKADAAGREVGRIPSDGRHNHSVVIEGYARVDRSYAFKVRNWWGPENLGRAYVGGAMRSGVLSDLEMCRVFQVMNALSSVEASELPVFAPAR